MKLNINTVGFTLVELMLVIAIMAILVALALPNYQQSIRKGRRADAQTDLIEFIGQAERVFTQTNSYATATLPANTDYYTYTFSVAASVTAYTIQAAPKTIQNQDDCGTMRIDQAGLRTKTGTLADCW
ncbi:MAG: prepilin-type N-terminal cleavage/methylation domain-containing protein [Gammaproteobacteria bacterium]|nr:prepilin-type N-terminal cleavage/methylation domain-containing protein [Gammaproteobacteria bacterium]